MIKGFFKFAWGFLLVISCILIPTLLIDKEYGKLIIVLGIIAFLGTLSVWLYRILVLPAKEFVYSETEISFVYEDHSETVNCCDVTKIIVTPNRYIFCSGKKYAVTRIKGAFKGQEEIDPRISEISESFHIPCLKKFV